MPADSTTVADLPLTEEVRAFCRSHDLLEHLGRSMEFARNSFAIVGDPAIRLEEDPEDGERYLVLAIRVEGDECESARADQDYLRCWANSTPWPAVHLIRLVYDLAAE